MAERAPEQENENTTERAGAAIEVVEANDTRWTDRAKKFLGSKPAKIGGVAVLSLLAVPVAIIGGLVYGAAKLADYGVDKLMAGAPGWMKDLYKKLFSGSGKKEK